MTSTATSGPSSLARARRQQAHLRSMQLALSALAALAVLFVSVGASPGPEGWSRSWFAEPYQGNVPSWLLAALAAYAAGALFWAHVVLLLDRVGATRWRRSEGLCRGLRHACMLVLLIGVPLVFAVVRAALLGEDRDQAAGAQDVPVEGRIVLPASESFGAVHWRLREQVEALDAGITSAEREAYHAGAGVWVELVAERSLEGDAAERGLAGSVQLGLPVAIGPVAELDPSDGRPGVAFVVVDPAVGIVRITLELTSFGAAFPQAHSRTVVVTATPEVTWGAYVRALQRIRLRGKQTFHLLPPGELAEHAPPGW